MIKKYLAKFLVTLTLLVPFLGVSAIPVSANSNIVSNSNKTNDAYAYSELTNLNHLKYYDEFISKVYVDNSINGSATNNSRNLMIHLKDTVTNPHLSFGIYDKDNDVIALSPIFDDHTVHIGLDDLSPGEKYTIFVMDVEHLKVNLLFDFTPISVDSGLKL
ncbi:hypothetical protein G7084_04220 [Weissella coleopterorum]|uniref:Uncharacterized protein n=1 Tax=Weissella coleopterorum TaxID=2714949 RepID=A0A6G8B006_9LACO|nr:hypothetical protein [Weissella coleopterorum]QIL50586.1 hypothetical protein G7084_04220 [Weissella coleopterorum]